MASYPRKKLGCFGLLKMFSLLLIQQAITGTTYKLWSSINIRIILNYQTNDLSTWE